MSYKYELQSNNADLQTVLNKINALPDQVNLPALSNPAGAANIESGYQAIDESGVIINGAMQKIEFLTGSFTGSKNTTQTISALVGKKNMILYCAGTANYTEGFAYVVYLNGSVVIGRGLNGYMSNPTVDNSTGKITVNTLYKFASCAYNYIIW